MRNYEYVIIDENGKMVNGNTSFDLIKGNIFGNKDLRLVNIDVNDMETIWCYENLVDGYKLIIKEFKENVKELQKALKKSLAYC